METPRNGWGGERTTNLFVLPLSRGESSIPLDKQISYRAETVEEGGNPKYFPLVPNKINPTVQSILKFNGLIIIGVQNCGYTRKALVHAFTKKIPHIYIDITGRIGVFHEKLNSLLQTEKGMHSTMPIVVLNGELLGGCEELMCARRLKESLEQKIVYIPIQQTEEETKKMERKKKKKQERLYRIVRTI
jgi:glutaredoxin